MASTAQPARLPAVHADRGWIYVEEPEVPSCGLFLPMGPRVAILGYLDDPQLPPRRPPFEEHLDLCDSMIEWFNSVFAKVMPRTGGQGRAVERYHERW